MCLIWNLTPKWNCNVPSVCLVTTMSLLPFPAKNMSFSPFAIYRHLEPHGSCCQEIWYPMKHLGIPSFLLTGLSSHDAPVPCVPFWVVWRVTVVFPGFFASSQLFLTTPLVSWNARFFPSFMTFSKEILSQRKRKSRTHDWEEQWGCCLSPTGLSFCSV